MQRQSAAAKGTTWGGGQGKPPGQQKGLNRGWGFNVQGWASRATNAARPVHVASSPYAPKDIGYVRLGASEEEGAEVGGVMDGTAALQL